MSDEPNKNDIDEMVRRICDKQAVEAMEILGLANKSRAERVKQAVIEHFKKFNRIVSIVEYKQIVKETHESPEIRIARKSDSYDDLASIEDLE